MPQIHHYDNKEQFDSNCSESTYSSAQLITYMISSSVYVKKSQLTQADICITFKDYIVVVMTHLISHVESLKTGYIEPVAIGAAIAETPPLAKETKNSVSDHEHCINVWQHAYNSYLHRMLAQPEKYADAAVLAFRKTCVHFDD